jgi:hypothetical protein
MLSGGGDDEVATMTVVKGGLAAYLRLPEDPSNQPTARKPARSRRVKTNAHNGTNTEIG